MEKEAIEFDDKIESEYKRNLDSGMITSILLYAYGEAKTAEQIAKNLKLHIIKAQYYLDYMVRLGYLVVNDEKVVDGIMNKTYCVREKMQGAQITVGSEEHLAMQAKDLATMMEQSIRSMRKDKICGAQATSVFLDDTHAKLILAKMQEFHKYMETCEKECFSLHRREELKQYHFISTFGDIEESK